MKRTLSLILLFALLCTLLAACDDPAQTPTDTGSSEVTTQTATDTDTASTDGTLSADTGKTTETQTTESEKTEYDGKVIAAVNFEKDVVCTLPGATVDDLTMKTHIIQIPKINSGATGAKALNKKIYDAYAEAYDLLKQNREDSIIYRTTYKTAEYAGIVQISVTAGAYVQFSDGMTHNEVYYYDPANDKELTADQFLSLSGLNWKKIEAAIRANPGSLFLMGDENDPPYTVRLQTLYLDPENEHYCTVQVQHDFGEYSDLGIYFFTEDQVKTFRK